MRLGLAFLGEYRFADVCESLFLYDVSDVFDGFANLALRAANRRLGFSSDFVDDAFVVQVRIPCDRAGRLLDLPFECFGLAFEFSRAVRCEGG